MDTNPPGLLSRTIDRSDPDVDILTEVWDVTVPYCPMLVLDMSKWPFEHRPDARTVTRKHTVRKGLL